MTRDRSEASGGEKFAAVNDQTGERKDVTVDQYWSRYRSQGWRIDDPAAYRAVADAPVMGEAQIGTVGSVAQAKAAEARAAADAKAAEEAAKG